MTENTILYFDLENTLIEHWTDQRLCWVEGNKSILHYHRPVTIGIFSFALWCGENIEQFIHGGMKNMIEQEYDIQIDTKEIIHVNDMIETYNLENDKSNHPGSNNKSQYFIAWAHSNIKRLESYDNLVLVDDTIEECMFNIGEKPVYTHFRNPVEIEDFI